ncbi:hypothetical protein V8E53_014381 [Lactarius tabidus]
MDTEPHRQLPEITFRVLIIGRANAGKTSILQRVCETTESPFIYREMWMGREEVNLELSMERGEHSIDDELVFSNHLGYVFHDSCGIESGSTKELGILQEFIQRKCRDKQLRCRLHAIWYCVPMDNQRPELDLKFYKDICLDKNVPVIVVFTKYDQFLCNVEMQVLDYPDEYPDGNVTEAAGKLFREHYLDPLGDDVKYVQLQKMQKERGHCGDLLEKTATALDKDTVALMLLAVQRSNLELSVEMALNRVYSGAKFSVKDAKGIIYECVHSFPHLWVSAVTFSICGRCLTMFGCEWLPYLQDFRPADNTCPCLSVCEMYLTLGVAVIIILKHATFLLLSNLSSESALTQAETDYKAGNIGPVIQQFLKASPQIPSKEQFSSFIKANDIGMYILAPIHTISYQAFSAISEERTLA